MKDGHVRKRTKHPLTEAVEMMEQEAQHIGSSQT